MEIAIEELLKQMLNFFQDIDKRMSELSVQQSKWDSIQDEFLHYIENHNMNAVKSCKIIKQLKYVRNERRKVKNEIDVIRSLKATFVDKYNNKFIEKDLIQAIKNLNDLNQRQINIKYTYQYLTEELEIINEQVQKQKNNSR